jgi:hypothetical protein
MTAELCPTCGLWWRGMEHSCRLPIADTDPRDAEIARLRAALDGLVEAAEDILGGDEHDALRVALAAAKEAGG